ncbi:conserved hypothetical protein [Psychromonas ingrahamii 37]|uniref:DUF3010 domain-containing protein n=1 Tax=Psychromonas ingrahamii (strain DSM 17664 / CCUG 51855 / 37) TaxID=357804 RepID=A1SVF2_PSYIN|nr:DUF3010 family protein [Psychromonas ingrahamii]ABM03467.1 conserved hypothetical protein [Psychromonas ingrahamii 37]
MRVCGVELTGNEAIISILQLKNGLYDVPKVRATKLSLPDPINTDPLRKFQFEFSQLMKDYQVDTVVIKQRDLKGKYAGNPLSFKIEGALQLMSDLKVHVLSSHYIKEGLSFAQVKPDVRELGLKQFQNQAMLTAFAYLEQQAALSRSNQ